MKYYYETKPGELEHGLLRKKKAKYIAKIPMGNNTYRYFYDADELAAYKESLNKNIDKSMETAKKKRIADVERDIQRRLESESKAKAVEKKRNARQKTKDMLAERQSQAMGRGSNGRASNYPGKDNYNKAKEYRESEAKKKRIADVERDIQRRLESESKAREVEEQRKRRKKLKRTTTHVQYLLNNYRKRAKRVRDI